MARLGFILNYSISVPDGLVGTTVTGVISWGGNGRPLNIGDTFTVNSVTTSNSGITISSFATGGVCGASASTGPVVVNIGPNVVPGSYSVTMNATQSGSVNQPLTTTISFNVTASTVTQPVWMSLDQTNNKIYILDLVGPKVLVYDTTTLTNSSAPTIINLSSAGFLGTLLNRVEVDPTNQSLWFVSGNHVYRRDVSGTYTVYALDISASDFCICNGRCYVVTDRFVVFDTTSGASDTYNYGFSSAGPGGKTGVRFITKLQATSSNGNLYVTGSVTYNGTSGNQTSDTYYLVDNFSTTVDGESYSQQIDSTNANFNALSSYGVNAGYTVFSDSSNSYFISAYQNQPPPAQSQSTPTAFPSSLGPGSNVISDYHFPSPAYVNDATGILYSYDGLRSQTFTSLTTFGHTPFQLLPDFTATSNDGIYGLTVNGDTMHLYHYLLSGSMTDTPYPLPPSSGTLNNPSHIKTDRLVVGPYYLSTSHQTTTIQYEIPTSSVAIINSRAFGWCDGYAGATISDGYSTCVELFGAIRRNADDTVNVTSQVVYAQSYGLNVNPTLMNANNYIGTVNGQGFYINFCPGNAQNPDNNFGASELGDRFYVVAICIEITIFMLRS